MTHGPQNGVAWFGPVLSSGGASTATGEAVERAPQAPMSSSRSAATAIARSRIGRQSGVTGMPVTEARRGPHSLLTDLVAAYAITTRVASPGWLGRGREHAQGHIPSCAPARAGPAVVALPLVRP